NGLVAGFDRLGAVLVDFDGLAAVGGVGATDFQAIIVEDFDGVVALVLLDEADFQRIVVLDDAVKVLLGVEINLFTILFVLKADFVEVFRGAVLGTARFEHALRLVGGQFVRRHLLGVVYTARDNGPIRVAFEEVNDYFVADARVEDDAPVLAGPVLGDA